MDFLRDGLAFFNPLLLFKSLLHRKLTRIETVRLFACTRQNIRPWYEEYYEWTKAFKITKAALFVNGDETALDLTHREKWTWSEKPVSVQVPSKYLR